ncbi:MAG: metallophosphoesterase [Deltaproteobacteria bacterium]|nr:metallophosphoesterase [Deltaproteobacteria bacterium]
MRPLRLLLLADTHIGFDCAARPRVKRRRRGPDFLANLTEALEPALRGEVDVVVHGGDYFHRPGVPDAVVRDGYRPLLEVAECGVPVFIVPGNHERSRMPLPLLLVHPNIRVFDRPRAFSVRAGGHRLQMVGFPNIRNVAEKGLARVFAGVPLDEGADVRLLCMHQAFAGAQVGAQDYTFRFGADVVAAEDLPTGFAAVLSGHIHRAQVLEESLDGSPLRCPVIYPGSVERTSYAEREEAKGYARLQFAADGNGGRLLDAEFVPLPARPMLALPLHVRGLTAASVEAVLRDRIAELPQDAIVRVQVLGSPEADIARALTAARLRKLAPPTMNIDMPRGRTMVGRHRID